MPTRLTARDIMWAVNISNELRTRLGEERIADLPKGIPGVADRCVLARAFNFDCTISGGGAARFPASAGSVRRQVITRWARSEGLKYDVDSWYVRVFLPPKAKRIVHAFDSQKMHPSYYSGAKKPTNNIFTRLRPRLRWWRRLFR